MSIFLIEVRCLLRILLINHKFLTLKKGKNLVVNVLNSPFHYKLVKTNLVRQSYYIQVILRKDVNYKFIGSVLWKSQVMLKKLKLSYV